MLWFCSCKIHQAEIKISSGESLFSWLSGHVTLIHTIVISHELRFYYATWTQALRRLFHVSLTSPIWIPCVVCPTSPLAECTHCYESSCSLLSYWLFSLALLLLEQLLDVWRPLRHEAPYWLRIMMLWNGGHERKKREWTSSKKCFGFFCGAFGYLTAYCLGFQGSGVSWLTWGAELMMYSIIQISSDLKTTPPELCCNDQLFLSYCLIVFYGLLCNTHP